MEHRMRALTQKQSKSLRGICSADIKDFRSLGTKVLDTDDGPAIWIDRGGDTLAVGHLDYVKWSDPEHVGDTIYCPQLDDRLGVWALLYLVPSLTDVKYDVLLCDSEEVGRTTAKHAGYDANAGLQVPKRYNWIWELDRAGDDAVTYDYMSLEWRNALRAGGFDLGWGSFTDICDLENLEVSGVNVGIGYHLQHTKNCYADLDTTVTQCAKFAAFLEEHHETLYFHNEETRGTRRYGIWPYQDDSDEYDDWWRSKGYGKGDIPSTSYGDGSIGLFPCYSCGEPLEWRAEWNFCPYCGQSI